MSVLLTKPNRKTAVRACASITILPQIHPETSHSNAEEKRENTRNRPKNALQGNKNTQQHGVRAAANFDKRGVPQKTVK